VVRPDSATGAARIKVEAADNIYFDISNVNFTIVSSTASAPMTPLPAIGVRHERGHSGSDGRCRNAAAAIALR
jgi:hypothetical protein